MYASTDRNFSFFPFLFKSSLYCSFVFISFALLAMLFDMLLAMLFDIIPVFFLFLFLFLFPTSFSIFLAPLLTFQSFIVSYVTVSMRIHG